MNKEDLTAIDLLAIRQAKGKLETLDVEFRRRHVTIVDTVKVQSCACEKFLRSVKIWPLDKFIRFLFMRFCLSSIL